MFSRLIIISAVDKNQEKIPALSLADDMSGRVALDKDEGIVKRRLILGGA